MTGHCHDTVYRVPISRCIYPPFPFEIVWRLCIDIDKCDGFSLLIYFVVFELRLIAKSFCVNAGRLVGVQREKSIVRAVHRRLAVSHPWGAHLSEAARRVRRADTRGVHHRPEPRRTVPTQRQHRARGLVGSETRTVHTENPMEICLFFFFSYHKFTGYYCLHGMVCMLQIVYTCILLPPSGQRSCGVLRPRPGR